MFYCNLRSNSKLNYVGIPDQFELITFWKSIFEHDTSANLNSSWLPQLKEKFTQKITPDEFIPAIISDILTAAIH